MLRSKLCFGLLCDLSLTLLVYSFSSSLPVYAGASRPGAAGSGSLWPVQLGGEQLRVSEQRGAARPQPITSRSSSFWLSRPHLSLDLQIRWRTDRNIWTNVFRSACNVLGNVPPYSGNNLKFGKFQFPGFLNVFFFYLPHGHFLLWLKE